MEPSAFAIQAAIIAVPLLTAVVFHEVAHGAMALACGDPTAQRMGRLTLNPLPHVDPIGTLLLPAALALLPLLLGTKPFLFGYAKPVPINPRNFRHPRRDEILVALAGPGTNLLLATACAFALGFFPESAPRDSAVFAFGRGLATAVWFNCLLAVFNLLPVPPLDGGRVLQALLPFGRAGRAMRTLEGVGMVVVVLVVMNTGVVTRLVAPVAEFLLRWGTR